MMDSELDRARGVPLCLLLWCACMVLLSNVLLGASEAGLAKPELHHVRALFPGLRPLRDRMTFTGVT